MPIHTSDEGWVIETRSSAYALGVNPAGLLAHRYWGPRLPFADDYPPAPDPRPWASFNAAAQLTPEEYPAFGDMKFIEPCLKLTLADGARDLALRVVSAELIAAPHPELRIRLRDAQAPVNLTLHYRVYEACDLIARWAEIANQGDAPIVIERAFSALWHLPPGTGYRLSHMTGRWFDEGNLRRDRLPHGVTVLESRRITSSHHHSPWFMADAGDATPEHGAVWFGALAWSGSWKLAAEVTDFGSTRLAVGVNDWDFAWRLLPGERFTTPACLAGYSAQGFGGASRCLHDYVRDELLREGRSPQKVIYNSWEATQFAVDAASQIALAEVAASLGVELFVMDDGWFQRRNDDTAALGDWWPDAQKFPHGLTPLIDRVNALGMQFGLWVEPEMVSPDSDLYRAHPDWVIHFADRPRTLARNQLLLNMARSDVQGYLIALFDRLLNEHNISYVKWDMNRNVSEPGWPDAPGDPRELWVRYVEGVYRVWGELRERHPRVTWLSCSGGGGRADLGILRLADRVQISDNTEATAVLAIQQGFAQFLPARAIESWVTDVEAELLPLAFRFRAAMAGIMVIGGHLTRWPEAQRREAAALIAEYKSIRHLVHGGDRYQLLAAQGSPCSAVQFMSADRSAGVVLAFRSYLPAPGDFPPLVLRGLDPEARYEVAGIAGARSGLAWATVGLRLALGNFESALLRIRRLG